MDEFNTYIILGQIWVVPLDAVIQDGDHHILAGVAPLPSCENVHLCVTATVPISTMLQTKTQNPEYTAEKHNLVDFKTETLLSCIFVPPTFWSLKNIIFDTNSKSMFRITVRHHKKKH